MTCLANRVLVMTTYTAAARGLVILLLALLFLGSRCRGQKRPESDVLFLPTAGGKQSVSIDLVIALGIALLRTQPC